MASGVRGLEGAVLGLRGMMTPLGALTTWTNFNSDSLTVALESRDRLHIVSRIEIYSHAIQDADNPRQFVQDQVVRWLSDVKTFGPSFLSAYTTALAAARART